MDDMLGYIRHKSQFKLRSPLHVMAGTGEQGGSCALGLDKQNLVVVVCLYPARAVRENWVLSKKQADSITSSKAKILQTHYAEDANSLTELIAHMKNISQLKGSELISRSKGASDYLSKVFRFFFWCGFVCFVCVHVFKY